MSDHLDPVRAALDGATDAAFSGGGADGGGDGEDSPRVIGLPDDCPVKAIGTEGGRYYFLTTLGELRELKADQVANKHIVSLFSPRSDYLFDKWPRRKQVKEVDPATGEEVTKWITTGWRTDDVSMQLMDAAASKGVWNSFAMVRGRGGWLDADGQLVLHAGDRVLINGRWVKPGEFGGLVYPTMPPSPRPDTSRETDVEKLAPKLAAHLFEETDADFDPENPGQVLLALFGQWQFERPLVDARLLLGWNAIAPFGAALRYRPLLWLTGDAATGKSTLQELVGHLHGKGILQSPDATEAGVRQVLDQQSLPVAIDEAEAEADNRKIQALVKLARLAASSQGDMLRGGQDHQGHSFRAMSCFLFSSILIPPMPPQDRSRLGVLELAELPKGQRQPPIVEREIAALAGQVRRIMVERWPQWEARLAMFKRAMVDHGGHGGRAADQFGTLIAAADLLLNEHPPKEDMLKRWGELLAVDVLAETANRVTDAEECIEHLTTHLVQLTGHGAQRTVSEWLLQAAKAPDRSRGFVDDTDSAEERRKASEALDRIGIAVPKLRTREAKPGKPGPVPGVAYVAVANNHTNLARLFADTRWGGGRWTQALGRAPGAVKDQNQRITGKQRKCVLVPLVELVTPEGGETLKQREEVEA